MNPAPTQATIDSASRTKPRAKANTAERPITAMTPMSSGFIRSLWRCRHSPHLAPALGGRQPLDQFGEMADRHGRDAVAGAPASRARPRRNPGLGKAEFRGFLEPRLAVRD